MDGNGERRHVLHLGSVNQRVTLRNVAELATDQALVDIEAVALEALGSAPKGKPASLPTPTAKGEELTPAESRAVMVARLVSLLQGRTDVRREVIELLVAILNKGLSPVFHSLSASRELCTLVMGGGQIIGPDRKQRGETKAMLSSVGLAPIEGLTASEASALVTGTFGSLGPAALQAYAISNLAQQADALAAISCEAVKASIEPFQAVHFDIHRPHRGQIASASSLRLCLEGSTLVQSAAGGGGQGQEPEPDAIRCIPQIHGPCRETIEAGIKSLELELNSAEGQGASAGSYHPAQVDVVLKNLQAALGVLARASQARVGVLMKKKKGDEDGDEGSSSSGKPIQVEEGTKILATELSQALMQLKALEDAAAEASKAKEKGPPEGVVDAQRGGGAGGAGPDIEEQDPVKRARIEAARKAKAEKAAAKAAAKAAKKGAALVLGMGTRELKDWLVKATGGSIEPDALASAINPLQVGSESATEVIKAIIERLGSGGQQRKPKIAKGTRDFGEEQMLVREEAFSIIRRIFKLHGAKEIDTPVFELKETLTGKYGEDSKLIYDLADQGGELLSLRYDLTVPFARYIAMYNPGNLKRYHIAKVYRRDNPAMARGRFREFYQCDFDIAGSYPLMVPDAEVITVAVEILSSLPIGTFEVKLNHRRLLDSVFDICGVPAEKFRTICSAVDKLDKEPWEAVRREMTEDKGLRAVVADKIGTFVQYKGPPKELLAKLMDESVFGKHEGANAALEELKVLFDYLEALDSLKAISFDLSLARGLDYYTGVIYEVVLTDKDSVVGSIAAGGRYDNLVGMFSASGQQTPCVGVSIGVERVLTIMEARKAKEEEQQIAAAGRRRSPFVEVLVATIGAGMLPQRMRLAKALWKAGIPAEYLPQDNPKLKKQMEHAHESGIPFLVIVGSDELKKGNVKIKDPRRSQEESEEEVPESEMAANLISKGARLLKAIIEG